MKQFILDIPHDDWKEIASKLGMKPFAATQLISWIYAQNVLDPDKMTNLPKDGRAKLKEEFSWKLPEIAQKQLSSDGTQKITLRLRDGHLIECVAIPSGEKNRLTVCVSSQVGCTLGCDFCRTAGLGFERNLTLGEITSQIFQIQNMMDQKITNIVFMGMGEPLLNKDNVINAIKYLADDKCFNFAKNRITVSTAGIVPEILNFFDQTNVKIAISLNSAIPEKRLKLMPIEKKYPLSDLLEVCKKYSKDNRHRVTFEYVMLKDVNDTKDDLKALINALNGIRAKINLIMFNKFDGSPYEPSLQETVDNWWKKLYDCGIQTNVRRSRGQDILAACGQLAASQ